MQAPAQGFFPLCFRYRLLLRLQLRRRPQRLVLTDSRIPLALRWLSPARHKMFYLRRRPLPVLPINSHREARKLAEIQP